MTTTLMALYAVVMLSGFFGLVLQHHMPRLMKERLPAETVFEQIPHIRAQLRAAAEKMSDSFKEAAQKTDAGAPASSAAKAVTSGSTPMASTAGDLSTPTARAKSTVGSTIAAETIATPAATSAESSEKRAAAAIASGATTPATVQPAPPETMGTPTARVPEGAPVPAGDQRASAVAAPPPAVVSVEKVVMPPAPAAPPAKPKAAPVASDPESEAALHALLSQQIIPYLAANRGDRLRLGKPGYSDELFRFVKLRVAEGYRVRVEEIQAWCDERRMLDLQTRLHHWLHGWLFIHVPISFLLLMMTAWHAFVTLFYY